MMATGVKDYVAIDTNVFLHLLNPQQNVNSHITKLLVHLQILGITHVVDAGERIQGEYLNQIGQILTRTDELGTEGDMLRYWIIEANPRKVPVNLQDGLMRTIRDVIIEPSEQVDRIFVYVTFQSGSVLISNDETHIVVGPPGERGQRPRRDRLLRSTRRLRPNGADILTSMEAYEKIR